MREHDRARTLATDAGFGRYAGFAGPAYSGEWVFFAPLGAFFTWTSLMAWLHVVQGRSDVADRLLAPLGTAFALTAAAICLQPRWQRRPGGPAARLYCFDEGVVVAVRGDLQPHRWIDLTLQRSDARRTLATRNGRILATFRGDEPARAGYRKLDRLHEAAIARRLVADQSLSS